MIVFLKFSQIKTYPFTPIGLSTLNNCTFLSKRYTIFYSMFILKSTRMTEALISLKKRTRTTKSCPSPKSALNRFEGICSSLNSWRANTPNSIQIYCALFSSRLTKYIVHITPPKHTSTLSLSVYAKKELEYSSSYLHALYTYHKQNSLDKHLYTHCLRLSLIVLASLL